MEPPDYISLGGLPWVQWEARHGTQKNRFFFVGQKESFKRFSYAAMIESNGRNVYEFKVKIRPLRWWMKYRFLARRSFFKWLGHQSWNRFSAICCIDSEALDRFERTTESAHFLEAPDLAKLQAGKLLFIEHQLILTETNDARHGAISRDCGSQAATRTLHARLTKHFITDKHPKGWAENEKIWKDARAGTPTAKTSSTPPAKPGYDPI